MFEKLLSLLPYNPSLAHQMAFYGKRMHAEASIRRLGLIFIVLAFFVQFFAVLNPPQSTVADSTNDLLNGGFSSAKNASDRCNDTPKFKADLNYFGIDCSDLASASTSTLSPTASRDGKHYYSAGRIDYAGTNGTPFSVPGDGSVYFRSFASVTVDHSDDWRALMVHNNAGVQMYILYKCGNLVSIGLPAPSPIVETISAPPINHTTAPALCQYNSSILASSAQCVPPCSYNSSIPSNSPQCFDTCRYNRAIPSNSPQCFQPCAYNQAISETSPECAPPCDYNQSILKTSPQCFPPCQYNSSIPSTSSLCYQPCKYNNTIPSGDTACKPCDKSVSSSDTLACISVSKTASNVTTGTTDANGTTAKGGDVILYTLFAKNNGKEDIDKYIFKENLSDVLDYADSTDLHGGTLADTDKTVTWPDVKIKAGDTAQVQVTVKIKDPIPQTPVSASDPYHFDLTMTNTYGNTINIKLPGSPAKVIETTAASLPNTGPGTSLFIGAITVMLASFFYFRARLLAKESTLAVQETATV